MIIDQLKIGQGIRQGGGNAAMLAGETFALIRNGVQIINAIQTGPEPGFISLQKDGPLAVSISQDDAGRRFADGILHHPGRYAHPVTFHPGTGALQQLHAPRMGHLDAGSF